MRLTTKWRQKGFTSVKAIEDHVYALYQEYGVAWKVAHLLRVCEATVCSILKSGGHSLDVRNRIFMIWRELGCETEDQVNQMILKKYNETKDVQATADFFKVTSNTIRNRLRALNVPMKARGGPNATKYWVKYKGSCISLRQYAITTKKPYVTEWLKMRKQNEKQG